MSDAKRIVESLLEMDADQRLRRLRARRGEVPGGFKATRNDGETWEFKMDPKSNAYLLIKGGQVLGTHRVNSNEGAHDLYAKLLGQWSLPAMTIEEFPPVAWEYTPPGPVPRHMRV